MAPLRQRALIGLLTDVVSAEGNKVAGRGPQKTTYEQGVVISDYLEYGWQAIRVTTMRKTQVTERIGE